MKIYFGTNLNSFGISRVVESLSNHLHPNFEITDESNADLIVLHVTGRNEHTTFKAKKILDSGKSYAVIQYVLQSSRNPDPKDWYKLWHGAKVVWSYYDLFSHTDNLYHSPLAANNEKFFKQEREKKYLVGSIGNCYKAECIGEVQLATWRSGKNCLHIGEKFNSDPFVSYKSNVTDDELCMLYNSCEYFSSLRRNDGFEIPAIESLLCGVRPIMFDTPNYRQWFDGLAHFIPENSPKDVVNELKKIFKNNPVPVKESEIEEVKRRFDWEKIIKGFWEKCMI